MDIETISVVARVTVLFWAIVVLFFSIFILRKAAIDNGESQIPAAILCATSIALIAITAWRFFC